MLRWLKVAYSILKIPMAGIWLQAVKKYFQLHPTCPINKVLIADI